MKPTLSSRNAAASPLLSSARSWPATSTVPAVGRSSAPMMLSSVVLPQPDGPASDVNSPSSTSRSTPRSACTGTPSWSYTRVTPRTRISGRPAAAVAAPPAAGLVVVSCMFPALLVEPHRLGRLQPRGAPRRVRRARHRRHGDDDRADDPPRRHDRAVHDQLAEVDAG